ncbi:MAG: HNH endonuclease [Microgenomates group bacterium]
MKERDLEIRKRIMEIYNGECANKDDPRNPHHKRLTFHHIVFRSEGGSEEKSNLIPLCEDCHRFLHALIGENGLEENNKGSFKKRKKRK